MLNQLMMALTQFYFALWKFLFAFPRCIAANPCVHTPVMCGGSSESDLQIYDPNTGA